MTAMSDPQHGAVPEASRPSVPPQYGIQAPSEGKGLLPWAWAVERLARSRGYWLSTTRPDGRPHVAVVWGIWLDDRFYFATSGESRKGRNLATNPYCVVCPEQAAEAVMVEGVAGIVTNNSEIGRFDAAYQAKYAEESDTTHFRL